MTKSNKVLGFFSFWPLTYFIIFYLVVLLIKLLELGNQPVSPLFIIFMVLQVLTILEIFIMIVIYTILIIKNKTLSLVKKIIWGILIYFASVITIPIYWWIYLRRSIQ